jgi:hypothetical protein
MPLNLSRSPLRVPLLHKPYFEASFPQFPLPRLLADVLVERSDPHFPEQMATHQGLIVDTGSPYFIISHRFLQKVPVRIRQDFGMRPYRVLSTTGQPVMQRFCEVGLRFLAVRPRLAFVPDRYIAVKAYLLDNTVRPSKGIILGLDALGEHFIAHLEDGNSFLQLRP